MEKHPLLTVDATPVHLRLEASPFLLAEKPSGMPVHPDHPVGRGTLVNALYQNNRWLAEMETSTAPGVIHVLRPQDRGLVLIAKTDDAAEALRAAHSEGRLSFAYRMLIPVGAKTRRHPAVQVADQRAYGDCMVLDVESQIGDTAEILGAVLDPSVHPDATVVCYRIKFPVPGEARTLEIGLGRRIPLPDLELYSAPTWSACNLAKEFLSRYGFAYVDHPVSDPAVRAVLPALTEGRKGIPVIKLGGAVQVGYDPYWLATRLGLER